MLTIHLKDLEFYSFHGVHEEERILGNTFIVTVSVDLDVQEKITGLQQTLDYETVFRLIKDRMDQPTELLEILAQDLADLLHAADPRTGTITVCIEKKFPPLKNFNGTAGVTYIKNFK